MGYFGAGPGGVTQADLDSLNQVIFKWNGTDLTQLTGAGASPNIGDSHSSAPVLSVAVGVNRGRNVIRSTGPGGSGHAGWSVQASALSEPLPSRFILEYTIDRLVGAGTELGVMVCDEVDQGLAWAHFRTLSACVVTRFVAAGPQAIGATTGGLAVGNNANALGGLHVRAECNFDAGSPPSFYAHLDQVNGQGDNSRGDLLRQNEGAGFRNWQTLEASFNAWVPTTVGLYVRSNGAGVGDTAEITDLRILKHPADL